MKYLMLLVLLSGCASIPSHYLEDKRRIEVVVIMYENMDTIQRAHPTLTRVNGFTQVQENKCIVHYVAGLYDTLAHEIAHCYYGDYHK